MFYSHNILTKKGGSLGIVWYGILHSLYIMYIVKFSSYVAYVCLCVDGAGLQPTFNPVFTTSV